MLNVPLEVKNALRKGTYRKNYRILVLKQDEEGNYVEDFKIDNNNLISESVMFDERLCSGNRLTFGLCEGSMVQFKYFDKPNITGRKIHIYLDAEYPVDNATEWYAIPMGYFDIEECSLNFTNGITKAIGYNKLKSDYLDANAKDNIKELEGDSHMVREILESLLKDYTIEKKEYDDIFGVQYMSIQPVVSSKKYNFKYINPWTGIEKTFSNLLVCSIEIAFKIPKDKENEYNKYSYKLPFFNRIYEAYKKIMQNVQIAQPDPFKGSESLSFFVSTSYNGYFEMIINDFSTSDAIQRKGDEVSVYYGTEYIGKLDELVVPINEIDGRKNIYNYDFSPAFVLGDENYGFISAISEDIQTKYDYTEKGNKRILRFRFPVSFGTNQTALINGANYMKNTIYTNKTLLDSINDIVSKIECMSSFTTEAETIEISNEMVDKFENISLRNLQSAVYELNGEYGQMDKETDLFYPVKLNGTRLYPNNELYPSETLYPQSVAERTAKSAYERLWTDSGGIKTFRYLIVDYKTKDEKGTEVVRTMQRTINTHGTDNYNLTSNWLLLNLVWTEAQVEEYAQALIEKLKNVTWFPFEMWAGGMPWIECGDEIEVTNNEGTYVSYVLRRELKGIQNLKDTLLNGTLEIF